MVVFTRIQFTDNLYFLYLYLYSPGTDHGYKCTGRRAAGLVQLLEGTTYISLVTILIIFYYKAEILADFFSSVFTDEGVNNLPKMEQRNSDIATDEPFSQEEIKKLLLGLNTTKSPEPDKAHSKVLYELANVIDKPLFIIFKEII